MQMIDLKETLFFEKVPCASGVSHHTRARLGWWISLCFAAFMAKFLLVAVKCKLSLMCYQCALQRLSVDIKTTKLQVSNFVPMAANSAAALWCVRPAWGLLKSRLWGRRETSICPRLIMAGTWQRKNTSAVKWRRKKRSFHRQICNI